MNGKTEIFGIIGDPVSHSLSPKIHAFFAEQFGVNMAYAPFPVSRGGLRAAVEGAHALGIKGLNVTFPHKQTIIPFLAALSPAAERVGAVNTLLRQEDGYLGDNTDYLGIRSVIRPFMQPGGNVLIIGAGGSAYAACVAAAEEGAAQITIINRTIENALTLAHHVNKYYNVDVRVPKESEPELSDKYSGDIIIQTTTVGFGPLADASPVTPRIFAGAALAFDIIYSPAETLFLRQAKQAGIACVNGFPMLVYQAAAAFSKWFAVEYDGHEHIQTLQDICL